MKLDGKKNVHDGHKQRFRRRFENGDYEFDSFSDHEVLEFMLSYIIVRQDTNPIAHRLLDKFKTLHEVLSADAGALREVEGVGERTASFLKAQYALLRRYTSSEYFSNNQYLLDMDEFAEYLKSIFIGKSHEELHAVMFNGRHKIIASKKINTGDIANVFVDTRRITKILLDNNADSVILAHNHPGGNPLPSNSDIEVTYRLKELFEKLNIGLADHMIVAGGEIYSMFADKRFKMRDMGIKP